jgi:hypothetical protein
MIDNLNKSHNIEESKDENLAELIIHHGNRNGLIMVNDPTPMQGYSFIILNTDIIVFRSDSYEAVKKISYKDKINLESHEKVFTFTFKMNTYLVLYDKQHISFFMISETANPEQDYTKLKLNLNESILKVYFLPNAVI